MQILCEHNAWKMNYSTHKVQVSYFVELPQSNFPDYTNALTFPWLWAFSLTFPGFQKFQKSGDPASTNQPEQAQKRALQRQYTTALVKLQQLQRPSRTICISTARDRKTKTFKATSSTIVEWCCCCCRNTENVQVQQHRLTRSIERRRQYSNDQRWQCHTSFRLQWHVNHETQKHLTAERNFKKNIGIISNGLSSVLL